MNEHHPFEWQFQSGTDGLFDDLWTTDFDAFNLQPALDDIHRPLPGGTDSLHTLPLLDDIAVGNMSLDDPVYTSDSIQPPGLSTLRELIQGNPPPAPRQRMLPRRRSKYVLRQLGGQSRPISIPITNNNTSSVQSLAIQRWQDSPPDQESASLSAIYNAMGQRPFSGSLQQGFTPGLDTFRTPRGPSSSTSLDSIVSESSVQSIASNQSSASQPRRRRPPKPRGPSTAKAKCKEPAKRIFKCTFCCDMFKNKYDWARHEKSLHLNLDEWICTPHGGSVVLSLTGRVHCAYCSALDPTQHHLDTHSYSACRAGKSAPRTFRRKDHLVQHLRLVHALDTLPLIEDWKLASAPVTSRCGFCDARLSTWDERVEHLAAHFRSGMTMADWQGDHGFDDVVAARIENDFPPYLIAYEATTMVPFSATDKSAIDHWRHAMRLLEGCLSGPEEADNNNVSAPTTTTTEVATGKRSFTSLLSRHLASFAKAQMEAGVVPSDEMFQRESRRILFQESDDAWDQTVADDPGWMKLFRAQAGFGG
ncbi:hypothetical protein GQ44DRAFT_664942, partial [Phaeosphaeriaceae sp. PMI808]